MSTGTYYWGTVRLYGARQTVIRGFDMFRGRWRQLPLRVETKGPHPRVQTVFLLLRVCDAASGCPRSEYRCRHVGRPASHSNEFLELLRRSNMDTAILRTLDLGDERL